MMFNPTRARHGPRACLVLVHASPISRRLPHCPSPASTDPESPDFSLYISKFSGGVRRYNSGSATHQEGSSSSSPSVTSSSSPSGTFPWLQGNVPSGFWGDQKHQRQYMEWLGEKLGYSSREDWYRVSVLDFENNYGVGILACYERSPSRTVSSVLNDHTFLPWLFNRSSFGYFKSLENRQRYIDWLVKKVGVASPADLKHKHFLSNHGRGLLGNYGGWSPLRVLDSLKSDFDPASASKREHKPHNYWSSLENQRATLDKIGASIGVKDGDLSPWYTMDQKALIKLGLSGLLREKYYSSHYAMLKKVYPEYKWQPWKFKALPKVTYGDPNVAKESLDYIEAKCEITKPEQWYRVSHSQLLDLGVAGIVNQNGGLFQLLKTFRSDFSWAEENFVGVRSSGYKTLGAFLRRIWPNLEISENASLFDGSTLVSYLIPSLNLAFDFQSPREYVTSEVSGKTLVTLRVPQEKKDAADKSRVDLIVIPFWWDRTLPSLLGTILESDPMLKATMANMSEVGVAPGIPSSFLYFIRNSGPVASYDLSSCTAFPFSQNFALPWPSFLCPRSSTYLNPVVNANAPDPGVLFDATSGLFIATTTTETTSSTPTYPFPLFPIRVSKDLVNWKLVGHIFPSNDSFAPQWAASAFWAPEIHLVNGSYFAYFVARDKTSFLCVGVATSSSPFGPWQDSGRPLVRNASTESLDPTIFLNPLDSKYYVYWKQDDNLPGWKHWAPTKLFARALAPNMTSVADGSSPIFLIQNDLPWEGRVVEAPWMIQRGSYFYLFYSANDCCTPKSDYAVGVARSKSAIGPFQKKPSPVLASSKSFIGPGHCSVLALPALPSQLVMVYHSWLAGKVGGSGDNRTLMLDEVYWGVDGWPFITGGVPSDSPQPVPPMF